MILLVGAAACGPMPKYSIEEEASLVSSQEVEVTAALKGVSESMGAIGNSNSVSHGNIDFGLKNVSPEQGTVLAQLKNDIATYCVANRTAVDLSALPLLVTNNLTGMNCPLSFSVESNFVRAAIGEKINFSGSLDYEVKSPLYRNSLEVIKASGEFGGYWDYSTLKNLIGTSINYKLKLKTQSFGDVVLFFVVTSRVGDSPTGKIESQDFNMLVNVNNKSIAYNSISYFGSGSKKTVEYIDGELVTEKNAYKYTNIIASLRAFINI
jgi:hypothetical protein